MIFTLGQVKNGVYMSDLIYFSGIVLGSYLSCVAFTIVLVKLFFPLRTKEEMAAVDAAKVLAMQRAATRQRRVTIPVLGQPRQLA